VLGIHAPSVWTSALLGRAFGPLGFEVRSTGSGWDIRGISNSTILAPAEVVCRVASRDPHDGLLASVSAMTSTTTILLLISAIAICVIGTVVVTVVFVKTVLRRAEQQLDLVLAGQPVLLRDPMANFFGLESLGPVQLRGNGSLALTRDTLAFMRALSKKPPLLIPRSAIQKVEATRSHLGKTVGRSLLTVHFVNAAGQNDVVAWFVRDLERWMGQLGQH
jgi:hypothetical protein